MNVAIKVTAADDRGWERLLHRLNCHNGREAV